MAEGREKGLRIATELEADGVYSAVALGEAVARCYVALSLLDEAGRLRRDWIETFGKVFQNAVLYQSGKECEILIREKM